MYALDAEPPITVRRAGPFDLGRLARLHRTCFEDAWTRAEIARLLAMPGAFALLARVHEPLRLSIDAWRGVGFAIARVASDEAELLSIGVAPSFRGRGIGARLLREVIDRCREAGARRLFLEVDVDNRFAQRLYESFGFERVGVRPDYYRHRDGTTSDAWTMRLDLEGPATPAAG